MHLSRQSRVSARSFQQQDPVKWTNEVRERRPLTNSDGVNHDCNFRDAPAHNDPSDGKFLLEGRAKYEETTQIERHRDVTCPEPHFCFEDTVVALNASIHEPFVRISPDKLADDDCDDGSTIGACGCEWREVEANWWRRPEENGVCCLFFFKKKK